MPAFCPRVFMGLAVRYNPISLFRRSLEALMATVSAGYQYLAPNAKSSYKQLFVKGTRLRARVLYGSYLSTEEPRSVEEIAADYNLPLEAVKEAIAYC